MTLGRIIPAVFAALFIANLVLAIGLWWNGDGKAAAGCMVAAAVAGAIVLAWGRFGG